VGRLAHELPLPHGRRSVAADVPARLAQRLLRSRPNDHEQWRLCGRRATKRSDWRVGRAADRWLCSGAAAASTSVHPDFSGPATGMAGDRGGDLAGAAPSAATCKPVSSPSGPRSRAAWRKQGPRSPGTGKGRRVLQPALPAWPCCVRDGSPSGARHRYPGGSTRSATARPRAAGRRPGPKRPGIGSTTRSAATPLPPSVNLARCFARFEYFEW